MAGLALCIGAESKCQESRSTLCPEDAGKLLRRGYNVAVQHNPQRVFPDSAYEAAGVRVVQTTEGFKVVAATKEFTAKVSPKQMHRGQILMAFHHCHKGQPHNLDNLRAALELGVTLFDYELFRPGAVQTINTSPCAGIAGAANGLAVFGKRRELCGMQTAFSRLEVAAQFGTIEALESQMQALCPITEDIRVLIVGSGACGGGAREVCGWLSIPELSPAEVLGKQGLSGPWFSVLRTEDIVRRNDGAAYDRGDYRALGSKAYQSTFERYIGRFNLLIFTPYWDERYPELLPRELILRRKDDLRQVVISDVTCDIRGSLKSTVAESTITQPVWSYLPDADKMVEGYDAAGIVTTAVDNLPAQLGESCSRQLSAALMDVLPHVLRMNPEASLEESGLPACFFPAFITWNGKLTQSYGALARLL